MLGISKDLAAELASRGYTDEDVAQLFDSRAWKGEIRVIYRRHPDREDFTSPLPSSHHMYYVAKGWTAVAIADPPADAENAEIVVPQDILDHGRKDRVGMWTRGTDSLESSCRNASALLAKGWAFEGLADEERRRAAAEARPLSASKAASPSPASAESKRK